MLQHQLFNIEMPFHKGCILSTTSTDEKEYLITVHYIQFRFGLIPTISAKALLCFRAIKLFQRVQLKHKLITHKNSWEGLC